MNKIWLDVPFEEKDVARSLGAKWDNAYRRWYAPAGTERNLAIWMREADAKKVMESLNDKEPEKGQNLSWIMAAVSSTVSSIFPESVWIKAEIANLKQAKGSHAYMELVERSDDGSEIAKCSAIIWADKAKRLFTEFESVTGMKLDRGMSILFLGKAAFTSQRGFSISIEAIDTSWSLGEGERKLREARDQLKKEGIQEKNRLLARPKDFINIAVLSPKEGAGLGDFMADALEMVDFGLCSIHVYDALFEGDRSKESLMSSFKSIKRELIETNAEVLVVVRGGGASTSLQWLNDVDLAREICMFPIPVFTGIGHEKDSTLLDECSNVKFDTPSKVIAGIREIICGNALSAQMDFNDVLISAERMVEFANTSLENTMTSIDSSSDALCSLAEVKSQSLKDSIDGAVDNLLKNVEETIFSLFKQIVLSGPRETLDRGYCAVIGNNGKWLKSKDAVLEQGAVTLILNDGEVNVKVDKTKGKKNGG